MVISKGGVNNKKLRGQHCLSRQIEKCFIASQRNTAAVVVAFPGANLTTVGASLHSSPLTVAGQGRRVIRPNRGLV